MENIANAEETLKQRSQSVQSAATGPRVTLALPGAGSEENNNLLGRNKPESQSQNDDKAASDGETTGKIIKSAQYNEHLSKQSLGNQDQAPEQTEATPTKGQSAPGKGHSKISMGSTGSRAGALRFAREISETLSVKVFEMRWVIFSLIVNSLLIVLVSSLAVGIVVPIPQDSVAAVGGVLSEIILLVANIISIRAIDNGLQAYYGNILATKGISMAVCGFAQAHSLFKWNYANELSLNSSVRKSLTRLSWVWILIELLKLMTPLPATAVRHREVTADIGTINCIEFNQVGEPVDRKWPTFEVQSGVAELIFGNSIGRLRSQEDVNVTQAIIGPQLIGAVGDGDTIVGSGFVADLFSECICTAGSNVSDFIAAGAPSEHAAELVYLAEHMASEHTSLSIANSITKGTNSIVLTAVVVNANVCGGKEVRMYPICKTVVTNHKEAIIQMRYMTDGSTASISQEHVEIREIGKDADIETWLYAAFLNIFGNEEVIDLELPGTVPGMLNPLFYWTSSELTSISPRLFDAGMETFYTILMRAGIQRSYGANGDKCVRNTVVAGQSVFLLEYYGVAAAYIALVFQLVASLCSVAAFVPWMLSDKPAGPAIRAVKESIYFTTLLADSNFSDHIRGLCNAPSYAIWQGLDVIVRVGEAVDSVDDEVGHITMDKPKLVRPMTNGRKYA